MGSTPTAVSDDNSLGESDTIEITGKVMVVAIIFLFMVVVFVLVLHLYAKWFWWNMGENAAPQPRQRRRRRRRFVFAPGQDPVIYESHQVGLDPSVLKSLPVLVFQPENFKEGLECAVCLCEIIEGEKARLLPKCNHGFHVDCIDMWFHSHSTCPLCRNPVGFESSKTNEENDFSGNTESSSSSSIEENSGAVNGLQSSIFPTNVLVWGNNTQVSSFGVSLEEEEGSSQQPTSPSSTPPSSSSSDGGNVNGRCHGMLVIDIPSECTSSSLSPSGSRCVEDEMKSPMAATLRSFKRLLSRDKKLSPCSPSSVDVEQAQS
ncbi:RING-H2 finger protein ATL3 [Vigna radiata var. radiata]|uniref:RING-type E3 ubiquitin transferase n=1 Tax=Vigna radiata var. radiata TaxID=3916 RepID=A0A1S3VT79_VIGRR|nr:RING-H2 finger protein ATL3 [Vigna radiata var. radiata]